MTKRPQLIIPAVILGVVFLAIAAIYWIDGRRLAALLLPRATRPARRTIHFKHGLAAAIVGLGCFVFAWFQTGGAPQRNRAA